MTTDTEIPSQQITTAIPFVNAPPHVGHTLELVLTDAIARHARQRGVDVHCQSGTDDNSLKNALAAERQGVTTEALVAKHAEALAAAARALDCRFDDFLRTSSDPRHAPAVHALWQRCAAAGDITRRQYRGLYCVGCEHFVTPEELVDGRCPEHDAAPERIAEDNYFFRLSRHAERLRELIECGTLRIEPAARREEALQLIRSGLQDFSISRSTARARGWGIRVPGDASQTVYVWFDALANYVSALGWPEPSARYERYWGAATRRTHVIGKGILRFHAVYWPAILLSAGLPLPDEILCHGYVTVGGRKLSKSLGNGIDVGELTGRYPPDAIRHFLLRHLHTTRDGDFSLGRLEEAHDAELADQLGNLVQRVTTLIVRHRGGRVPQAGERTAHEHALREAATHAAGEVARAFDHFAIHDAGAAGLRLVAQANRYADATEPWRLARASDAAAAARLDTVLHHLAEALRVIAVLFAPLLPRTAEELHARLGIAPDRGALAWPAARWGAAELKGEVVCGPVLFPKLAQR